MPLSYFLDDFHVTPTKHYRLLRLELRKPTAKECDAVAPVVKAILAKHGLPKR